jgi:hypothetical protein
MRSAADFRPIEPPVASDRAVSPAIAEQVGQEIIQNKLEPGAWATALAAGGGRHQEALAAYARIRMQQVSAQSRLRRAKALSLEARRLNTCLGIKTVQDLLKRSNRGGQLNLIKPRLSVVWLAILLVGSAGSVASIGRLLGDVVPDRLERWVPAMALLCGLAAVAGVLMLRALLRALLPKRWVMLGWNTALTTTCTLVCFGSLCFGAKLIARTSPEVIQKIASRPAAAPPAAAPGPPAAPAPAGPVRLVVKPRLDTTAALEALDEEE